MIIKGQFWGCSLELPYRGDSNEYPGTTYFYGELNLSWNTWHLISLSVSVEHHRQTFEKPVINLVNFKYFGKGHLLIFKSTIYCKPELELYSLFSEMRHAFEKWRAWFASFAPPRLQGGCSTLKGFGRIWICIQSGYITLKGQ